MAKINTDIVAGLIERSGESVRSWAQKHGFSQQAVSAWLTGARNISASSMMRLAKELQVPVDHIKAEDNSAIDDDRVGWVMSLPEADYTNIVNAYEEKRLDPDCILNGDNAVPVRKVPLVSDAAAASMEPGILMPLIDCVSAYSDRQIPFADAEEGDFAIRVVGTSMQPWYPPGTLLLCRPDQRITNGKRVIAVTDDGEILFKIFVKGKKALHLFSIDGNGKDFEFPFSGQGLRYVCRVISAQRYEDDVDKAMAEAGIKHSWQDKLQELEK